MHAIGIILLSVTLAGCASAVRGTTETVSIQVTPNDAVVTTDIGMNCVGSCDIEVKRKKEFTVRATKEGYEPAEQFVSTSVSGRGATGMAGNILLGGIVGVVVDSSTGAALDHSPNPVILNLNPISPSNAPSNNALPPSSAPMS